MKARIKQFASDHPILCLVLYAFVAYPALQIFAVGVFDPSGCSEFAYGRRGNVGYECKWSSNLLLDFILNLFFGLGPFAGTAVTLLFVCFPLWNLYCWIFKQDDGQDRDLMRKPVSPYGSKAKHREMLLKSGASAEFADETLSRYRDDD